jgi:hypothetical protein
MRVCGQEKQVYGRDGRGTGWNTLVFVRRHFFLFNQLLNVCCVVFSACVQRVADMKISGIPGCVLIRR